MLSYIYNKIFQKPHPNAPPSSPASIPPKDQEMLTDRDSSSSSGGGSDNENNDPIMMDVDLNVTASEESKGGIKYEVTLSEPATARTPLKPASPNRSVLSPLSVDKIQERLNEAAQRRKSLQTERIASAQSEIKKIDEVTKKKEEEEKKFVSSVKESLETKMGAASGKKQSIICDLKERLNQYNTEHVKEVQEKSKVDPEEINKLKELQEKKLETAEQNREKVIQTKLDSLKKHDEKVKQVLSLKKSNSQPDMEVDENNEPKNESAVEQDVGTQNWSLKFPNNTSN